jgi:hypothetical protein
MNRFEINYLYGKHHSPTKGVVADRERFIAQDPRPVQVVMRHIARESPEKTTLDAVALLVRHAMNTDLFFVSTIQHSHLSDVGLHEVLRAILAEPTGPIGSSMTDHLIKEQQKRRAGLNDSAHANLAVESGHPLSFANNILYKFSQQVSLQAQFELLVSGWQVDFPTQMRLAVAHAGLEM